MGLLHKCTGPAHGPDKKRINGTEARLLDRRLEFGPAIQTILVTPHMRYHHLFSITAWCQVADPGAVYRRALSLLWSCGERLGVLCYDYEGRDCVVSMIPHAYERVLLFHAS